MSSVSGDSASAALSQSQTQLTLATKFIKQNHEAQTAIADLVKASSENLQKVQSNSAPHIGANIDIRV